MAADPKSIEVKRNVSKARALLHSLVPRAQCFSFFDNTRECTWSSDGVEDYEVQQFVSELPEEIIAELGDSEVPLRRTLASGRAVLVLPIAGQDGERFGLLAALFSKNAGRSGSFNPGMIGKLLAPAMDVIAENLNVHDRLRRAGLKVKRTRTELDLVYGIDEKIHGAGRRQSSLAQLVGQSGRFLEIGYSVLLIPSKRIRVSATHPSWKDTNRKALDRYVAEQLMPAVQAQRKPVVYEIPDDLSGDLARVRGCDALLSPVIDIHDNVEGILAQIGCVQSQSFSRADRRFMANIVRKVEYVIERSFDTMTGFMNRQGFEAKLKESCRELDGANARHQLLYFDLDNLSLVNDTFGRQAGDEVIVRVAQLLQDNLPRNAVVSRVAGDEFCMLLIEADAETALARAQEIREHGSSMRYLKGDKSLQLTMSIGIAEIDRDSGKTGDGLTAARMACRAAKDRGRDRIEVYGEDDRSLVRRYDDMQFVAEIQKAIDGEGLRLFAQPIVGLAEENDRPHFEILLRMDDADGGDVPSEALFSAAERYRLMPQVDRWVISRTIATLVESKEALADAAFTACINLSGQSLGDYEMLEFIESEIEESGLQAERLCFEITESTAVSNLEKAQRFIDRLRERGCSIALDDFGTGLSSFAYLKSFSVDVLKIDGGFISDITENRISESMVAAITQVAKVMELETVAEHVESEESIGLLASLGVDYAQGHACGRPAPLDDVIVSLQRADATTD